MCPIFLERGWRIERGMREGGRLEEKKGKMGAE